MENKISYYAIVPANVRYDKGLPPNAKLLYAEITALSNEKGYCWASNEYFAKLYEVTNRTVTAWITILEEKGYVKREVIYEKDTAKVLERRIYMAQPAFFHQEKEPEQKKKEPKKKNNEELKTNFEKLWKLYPNKKGKTKAFNAYCKAIKEGTTNKQIQDGIVSYKSYLSKEDWQKPAFGSSWFHQNRWLDENENSSDRPKPPNGKKYKSVDDVMKGIIDNG